MTQTEMAVALNVTQSTVSMWENGNTFPTGAKLTAIAKLLNCSINELFQADDDGD